MIRREPKYILQGNNPGDNMDCMLIAGMNAMRYFGFDTPVPGDAEWNELSFDPRNKVWFLSGITGERGGDSWPRIVNVDDPEVEPPVGSHMIFEPEKGVVVNYRYLHGPVLERVIVDPRIIGMPGGSPWWSLTRGVK